MALFQPCGEGGFDFEKDVRFILMAISLHLITMIGLLRPFGRLVSSGRGGQSFVVNRLIFMVFISFCQIFALSIIIQSLLCKVELNWAKRGVAHHWSVSEWIDEGRHV